jgi:hypothetical protein
MCPDKTSHSRDKKTEAYPGWEGPFKKTTRTFAPCGAMEMVPGSLEVQPPQLKKSYWL